MLFQLFKNFLYFYHKFVKFFFFYFSSLNCDYYHCADKTKNCINKKIYLKEETINKVFDNAIKQIQITKEHRQAIIEALKDCHSEQQIYNTEEINRLNKRAEALRNRLSKIYLDKLDGNITEEFWQDKNNEWTLEHAGIMQKLDAYEKANVNYMKQASELLELLENLYLRYIQYKQRLQLKYNIIQLSCLLD